MKVELETILADPPSVTLIGDRSSGIPIARLSEPYRSSEDSRDCPLPIALDNPARLFISADGSRLPQTNLSHVKAKYE